MSVPSESSTFLDWQQWLAPVSTLQISGTLAPGREVFIYGSGTVAAEVVVLLRNQGVKVRAIIDGNTTRTHVADLPILRPDDESISPANRERVPMVVGIFNAFVDMPALHRRLAAQGWRQLIGFLDLHALFSRELGDRYWLTVRSHALAHCEAITRTDALWADETSRHVYRSILRYRVTGDDSFLPVPDTANQYFPAGIPDYPPSRLRFVDGGACTGDTLAQLAAAKTDVVSLALFEPDPANFIQLAAAARDWASRGIPAFAWPCGLHHKTGLLKFRPDRGAASGFSADGELTLPVAALDDVIAGFSPNLIKLDIEGAERAALEGGFEIIGKHRPALAVCVYHLPHDLWTLPDFVQSNWPGYRLYLRPHQHNGFDLVLYAVPV